MEDPPYAPVSDTGTTSFILPEEPVEVFATGSVLVREEIGAIGDVDTTTVVLKTGSGIHCQIINSRHCVFGFDQRIEAFGPLGAVHADNPRIDEVRVFTADRTDSRSRLPDFFLERYTESYNREWRAFLDCLTNGRAPEATFEDGLQALRIAEAANESLKTGASVRIS